ncbi:MAG: hypothetical protein RL095_1506 [Verrucomicrobiota bacterium]|jgi:ankyrin repeat protein
MLRKLLAPLLLGSLAACTSPAFPTATPAGNPADGKTAATKPAKLSAAILEMVAKGKRDRLARSLAKQAGQLSAVDDKGNSLLHLAAIHDHPSLCRELIAAGLSMQARNEDGRSPLAEAVWHGRSQVIRVLLEAGADAKALDKNGAGLLHLAAPAVRAVELKLLIAAGADARIRDVNGRSALHEAAAHRRPEFISILVEAGADAKLRDKNGRNALQESLIQPVSAGDCSGELLPISSDLFSVDLKGRSALHEAARQGHFEALRALVFAGSPVNAVDGDGRSALHDAAAAGKAEAVDFLIQSKADIQLLDRSGRSPAMFAIRAGSPALLQSLTASKSWALLDGKGRSLLHEAAFWGRADLMKLLLEHGLDVNLRALDGETPLHVAARRGRVASVDALLAAKADPRYADNDGFTPVFWSLSLEEEASAIIKSLAAAGAPVNAVSKAGDTALHAAARKGLVDCCRALLAAGADPKARDASGLSPADVARSEKQPACALLLNQVLQGN